MKQGIDPNTHKPLIENEDVKDKKIEFLNKRSDFFPSSSSSMPLVAELDQPFHINNSGIMLSSSSSMETNSIHDTFLSKSVSNPSFLVEFQSGMDQISYNSNFLTQYHHQTNYETSLPNLASFDNSGSKITTNSFGRESSSTTNSSNMNNNTSLSAGFQNMTFEGEMFQFNGINIKSEEGFVGHWQHHMHDVQVTNASSDFNIYQMGSGEYTDVFHQI